MAEKIYEVNLQEVVEKYVLKRFKEDMGFLKRLFFRKDKHYIDIRWGFVDFKHTTTSTDRPLPLSVREKDLDLYKSEYENETSVDQKYTFSTSRETTASTKIEIQDSYTIGAETNLEVDLGGIVKFGGGVSGETSVTNTKGEDHSETQTWNIDTEISVPKRSRATATLELKEIARVTDFQVKTIVSLPKGKLPVSIRKIAGNEVVKTYWITNISKIFEPSYLERSKEIVSIIKEQIEDKIDIKLQLTTQGVCKSVSGKEQRVKVEYKKLTSETEVQTHTGSTGALSPDEPVNKVDAADEKEESASENEANETDVMITNGK